MQETWESGARQATVPRVAEIQLRQLSPHAARVNPKFVIYPYCPNLEQPKFFDNKLGKDHSYF